MKKTYSFEQLQSEFIDGRIKLDDIFESVEK